MAITAIAVGVGAAVGIGATALSGGFGGKQAPTPQPPALPQAPNPDKAQNAAQNDMRRRQGAQTKTVYSSPLGTAGEANVARKTLLGQ